MKTVSGVSCVDAWQAAVTQLAVNTAADEYNLLVEIRDPTRLDTSWLQAYSPQRVGANDKIGSVVNTVFPYRLSHRCGTRSEFYDRYMRIYRRAVRGTWGTYFGRLVAFGAGRQNQLETAIEKLTSWQTRSRAAIVMHLSSPEIDTMRPRGQPCWQFAELTRPNENELDLVAVCRNHDYLGKALGNFIGLGQLLQFVCVQTNLVPGRLICHSIHAYNSGTKEQLSRLARFR